MTDGVLAAIKECTGDVVMSCPWRSFEEPIVTRVYEALPSFRLGNFAATHPHASARLIQGVTHYDSADNRIHARFLRTEAEARKR